MTSLGDDLEQARIFSTSALADMDKLLSDFRLDTARATKTLLNIQIEAKKMQARGIYRAAHSVVESYQNSHKQPKIDGRLMALYKLVAQYSAGLDEIAPIMNSDTEAASPELSLAPQVTYNKAKKTLTELLPFAKSHKLSLQRLMNLNLDAPAHTTPQISFESLMPEITDTALRNARGQGKSVSISYAAEHLYLEDSQVEQIRIELDKIVERLVRNKIATPEQRQNAGLPRSGHIDVSAERSAKGLDISVLCEGETIRFQPQQKPVMTAPMQEVGT